MLKTYFENKQTKIYLGDCIEIMKTLPDNSVDCCVTSPPYWALRDYGVDGQIGLENSPEEYIAKMVRVFMEVHRVLKEEGTLWLNLGDSYFSNAKGGGGCDPEKSPKQSIKGVKNFQTIKNIKTQTSDLKLKPKDLVGIPWRVAFALQEQGWYLRQDIIWHKPNPMPEPVNDRCTKSHEYLFLLTKNNKYYFDKQSILEPISQISLKRAEYGLRRNKRSVWTIPTSSYKEAHFATFPTSLIKPCILAGTSEFGCCETCGKSWERVIEKQKIMRHELPKNHPDYRPNKYKSKSYGSNEYSNGGCQAFSKTNTLGWQPSCKCESKRIPSLVLDPFGGSGTTAVVASQNKRNSIICELNQEYCEIATKRIQFESEQNNLDGNILENIIDF